MDAQLKAKWVEALRSGEYQQAVGRLRRDDGFCCLGVLCKVAGLQIQKHGHSIVGTPDHEDAYAPLKELLGGFNTDELWKRNDGLRGHEPHTFAQIADYIEANL